MSPPPPTPPFNPEDISPDVKRSGIAGMLGLMGMAVKIIMSDEAMSFKKIVTHCFVAVVVAILCGFAITGYVERPTLVWAINGLSGFMALKIVAFVEAMAEAKMQGKLNEARKAAGIKPKKTNAKPRRKAKR